jgi:thiol peroxidase
VPSVDTPTYHAQTRALTVVLQEFKRSIGGLTVSVDPPFAQARWKKSEECSAMRIVSDYKYVEFGERLGLYIESLGLLTHAVFLVDKVGSFDASITLRTSALSGSMG